MAEILLKGAKGGSSSFKQTPDNLRSNDTFEGVLGVAIGPLKGPTRGLKSIKLDGTAIENETGELNFGDFLATIGNGDPTQFPQPVQLKLGAGGTPTQVGLTLTNPNSSGPGPWLTKTMANTNADFIDLRFVVSQLYTQNKNGIYNGTATLEIQMKPVGSSTWINPTVGTPTGSYNQNGINTPGFMGAVLRTLLPESYYDDGGNWAPQNPNYAITGKTTSPTVYELRVGVPNEGPYANTAWDVRIRLLERESLDADPNFEKRSLSWESLSAVYSTVMGTHEDWRGVAWLQLYGKASDQLTGVPEITGEWDTKIVNVPPSNIFNPETRQYTGALWDGSWTKAFTTDPAWIINDAISDSLSGLSLIASGSYLNKWDALELSKWCSTLVPDGNGGQHPRYSMNIAISEPQKAEDFIRYLAGAVGALAWDDGDGQWRVKVDKPEAPTDIFTLENIEGEFIYSNTDVDTRFNDIIGQFKNAEMDYRQDAVRLFDNLSIANLGRKPTTIALVGCTNRQEAMRRVKLRLRSTVNETKIVNFVTNRRGRNVDQLSTILIADGDLGDIDQRTTGRTIAVSHDRTTITLRDGVYLAPGVTYKIKFATLNPNYGPDTNAQPTSEDWRKPTIVAQRTITNSVGAGGNFTQLTLNQPLPEDVADNLAVALLADGLPTAPKLYRVTSVAVQDDGERLAISAIEVDTGKWDASDNVTKEDTVFQDLRGVVSPPATVPGEPLLSLVRVPLEQGSQVNLQASWVRPTGAFISGFRIQYSVNGGALQTAVERQQLAEWELPNAGPGTYHVEVSTIDRRGNYSTPLTGDLEVTQSLIDATQIFYNTGSPNPPSVNDMMPNEPGADVTGNNTAFDTERVNGRGSAQITEQLDNNTAATQDQAIQIGDILVDVSDLQATYGNTASSQAYANAAQGYAQTANQAKIDAQAALTAANQARDTAISQSGLADQARQDAQAARDLADAAKQTAVTKAAAAAQSVIDSQGWASTAQGFSQTADQKATAAGQSAQLADAKYQLASTKAGEASQSATNALTSENNAYGYSVSAAQSQSLTATALTDAQRALADTYPRILSKDVVTGDHTSFNAAPVGANETTNNGRTIVVNTTIGYGQGLWMRSPLRVIAGRKFRVTAQIKRVTDVGNLVCGYSDWYDANGNLIYQATLGSLVGYSGAGTTYTYDINMNDVLATKPETAFIKLGILCNRDSNLAALPGTVISYVDALYPVDITESAAAAASAQASYDSSQTAHASEVASGQSASASDQSRIQAQTAAGEALGYRNDAAQAKLDAQGFSQTAQQQAGVAVSANTAATAAAIAAIPVDFQQDGLFWSHLYDGVPSRPNAQPANSGYSYVSDTAGRAVRMFVPGVGGDNLRDIAQLGAVRVVAGRRYGAATTARGILGTGSYAGLDFGIIGFSATYNYVTWWPTSFQLSNSYQTFTAQEVNGSDLIAAGIQYIRTLVRGRANNADGSVYVDVLNAKINDITEAYAASGSAQTATIKADAASQSAIAADGQRQLAQTAAGQADASRQQAATSEYNAGQSANSAATSQQLTAATYSKALQLTPNGTFDVGMDGWDTEATNVLSIASYNGRSNTLRFPSGVSASFRTQVSKAFPITNPNQRFRIRIGVTNSGGPDKTYYAGYVCLDSNNNYLTHHDGTGDYPLIRGESFPSNGVWIEREAIVGPGMSPSSNPTTGGWQTFPANAAKFILIAYINYTGVVGPSDLDYLTAEDVTSEYNAAASASAANISSGTASASKDLAGQYASAANDAKVLAQTAKSQAEAARGDAVQAKNDALGAQSAAATSATQSANASFDAAKSLSDTYPRILSKDVVSGNHTVFNDSGITAAETTNNGRTIVIKSDGPGYGAGLWMRSPMRVIAGRKIRVTAQVQRITDVVNYVSGYGDFFDANGNLIYQAVLGSIVGYSGAGTTYTYDVDMNNILATAPGTAFIKLGILCNRTASLASFPGTVISYVDALYPVDITESSASAASAQAALDYKTLAQASADAAGGSAQTAVTARQDSQAARDLAQGYASNAQGYMTNAQGYMNSAGTYSNQSASSYQAAVVLDGNNNFDKGLEGWSRDPSGRLDGTYYSGYRWTTANGGFGWNTVACLPYTAGADYLFSAKTYSINPNRKYAIRGRWGAYRSGATAGSNTIYMGVAGFDENGTYVDHGGYGTYRYSLALGEALTDGQTVEREVIMTGSGNDSWFKFPPAAKRVRLMMLANYTSGPLATYLDYLEIVDVTDREAAATSASVAQSAQAAASTSAATATTQATLAASLSVRSINRNPRFQDYPTASGEPTGWSAYTYGSNPTRVAGQRPGEYALRQYNGPSESCLGFQYPFGINPELLTITGNQYLVVTAEVKVDSGGLNGAGVLLECYNSSGAGLGDVLDVNKPGVSGSLVFNTDPDSSGKVVGNGTVGQTYRFTKLVVTQPGTGALRIYRAGNYSTMGPMSEKALIWYEVSVRAATPQEIAAGVSLPTLQASVSTLAGALAEVAGRSTAYWQTEVNAGSGATAFISARSDASQPSAAPLTLDGNYSGTNYHTMTNRDVRRINASNGSWGHTVYSKENYQGSAYVSFNPLIDSGTLINGNNNYVMCGLATGRANYTYHDINYAWYTEAGGLYIYESGSQAPGNYGAYKATDKLEIIYNGAAGTVTYKKNGTAVRTVTGVSSTLTFQWAMVGYNQWNGVRNAVFGPTAPSANSTVSIGAAEFQVFNPVTGGWKMAMQIAGGNVLFTGGLQAGAFIRQGNGRGWPVALAQQDFSVADGQYLDYGTTLANVPDFTFQRNNLAVLASGETYQLYIENPTTTGGTLRAKILTPATPSAVDLTSDSAPGSGPTRQVEKGSNGDAQDGNYQMQFQGTVTGYAYYVDDGCNNQCVWSEAFLHDGTRMGDAEVGHEMLVLNDDMTDTETSFIRSTKIVDQLCVRIFTESGCTLTASVTTPVVSSDGVKRPIPDTLGRDVVVLDNGEFRWEEIVRIEAVGMKPVAFMNCGDKIFAAGDQEDRMIFTHNIKEYTFCN